MKSDATSRPFPKTPEEWEALIAEAPGEDRLPDPEEEAAFQERAVVVTSGGYPAVRAALAEKRRRGPGRRPKKILLSIRYSVDVVEYFKSTGEGWQTRMDEALREWIAQHGPQREG
jgi:uncharacterized protein (DUF4415 family)